MSTQQSGDQDSFLANLNNELRSYIASAEAHEALKCQLEQMKVLYDRSSSALDARDEEIASLRSELGVKEMEIEDLESQVRLEREYIGELEEKETRSQYLIREMKRFMKDSGLVYESDVTLGSSDSDSSVDSEDMSVDQESKKDEEMQD